MYIVAVNFIRSGGTSIVKEKYDNLQDAKDAVDTALSIQAPAAVFMVNADGSLGNVVYKNYNKGGN